MSLVAKYALNKDTSGIGPAFPSLKSTMSFVNNGKIGKCLKINSDSTDYFNIPELENKKIISIAVWIKIDSALSSDWNDLISFYDGATGWNNTGICRIELYSNSTRMSLYSDAMNKNSIGDAHPGAYGTFFTEVEQNTWYHIVFTINSVNGYVKTYVNGQLKDTTNINNNWFCTGKNFQLGQAHVLSYNDLEFYDHELSPKEIQLLSQACILNYDFNDPYVESTENLTPFDGSFKSIPLGPFNNLSNQAANGIIEVVEFQDEKCLKFVSKGSSGRAYYTHALEASTYTWSFDCYSENAKSNVLHIERNGGDYSWSGGNADYTKPKQWQHISLTLSNTTNTTGYYFIYGDINVPIYIKNFQLEKKDHDTPFVNGIRKNNIIYDASGYGHHGEIINNISVIKESKKGNYSLQSYGSSDVVRDLSTVSYIRTDMESAIQFEEFSIEFTGRVDLWGYQISGLMSLSNEPSFPSDYTNSLLAHYDSSFAINRVDDGSINVLCNTETTPANEWGHYVLRYKNNKLDLFKNGILIKTKTASANYALKTFRYLYLGINCAGGGARVSSMTWSEFKIFATALSDNDIKDLYESKAYITNNQKLIIGQLNQKLYNSIFEATKQLICGKTDFMGSIYPTSTYETFQPSFRPFLSYNQKNTKIKILPGAIEIFRKPNVNTDTYCGLGLRPLEVGKDNLIKGHTYIITWTTTGQSGRYFINMEWSCRYGWGHDDLTPHPTDIEKNSIPDNFKGSQNCYYKFTIPDDIWKVATVANSNPQFEVNKSYISYYEFIIGFNGTETGALGTDVYISNLQMFDITNLVEKDPKIKIESILDAIGFNEIPSKCLCGEASDMPIKTLSDGSTWARIFWHNNNSGTQLFANEEEALNCQTDYKYSRLNLLEGPRFKGNDGKYEFLLEYPGDIFDKYNRWKQTNNPCTEYTLGNKQPATGLEIIHKDMDGGTFSGLGRFNPVGSFGTTLLTGCLTNGMWYYAVGAARNYSNNNITGIPRDAYECTDSIVQLWVRIDNTPAYSEIMNQEVGLYKSGLATANEFIEI